MTEALEVKRIHRTMKQVKVIVPLTITKYPIPIKLISDNLRIQEFAEERNQAIITLS